MLERLVSAGRSLGQTRDQWLHPLRRKAARKKLAQYQGTSVLVLCHGNMCRSPFAEAVLRSSLPAGMEVRSAGFVAPGRCAPPDAISAARRFGLDLSRHCSRLVTAGLVRASGLIVVMDPAQARELTSRYGARDAHILVLGDLDPLPIESRAIADPIMRSRDVFIDCFDRVERCAREMTRALHRAARARAPMYGEPSLSVSVTARAS